jgi:uncharacterized membrane protein
MAALDEPAAIALPMGMLGLTLLDGIAFAYFVIAWATYAWIVEIWGGRQRGLTAIMTDYRHRWMAEMLVRPNRIVDTQINMTLQQGSSFFASTSLLAVGACLGLMNSTDKAVEVMQSLSFGHAGSRQQWEVKLAGLMVIFVYAFFKFGWAYRVFNYCAILIGATPEGEKRNSEEAKAMAARAAKMNSIAAAHFNRGQRAFFFALGYLGWFAGPWVFAAATTAVFLVLYRRQYLSESRDAVL